MYQLENLSHLDFEELCRDIAQAEYGCRFSGFGPGPDGGIDGRHAQGVENSILQCKHFTRSSFSKLRNVLSEERGKIQKLGPSRYIFFTSMSLTPQRSDHISRILGALIKEPGDIWGKEDIEGALRRRPEIVKSHVKLWLSQAGVLERILQSGLEARSQQTRNEILELLRVYVRNPSFDESIGRLEARKILIIAGPPGVGKTTLAKVVAYKYLSEGWRFYSINSLDEGFSRIDDESPTLFFFDDFLGRIDLNQNALRQHDSSFTQFVRRVSRSKTARFILTTRAHIFQEARQLSDYIDDPQLQLAKYLLKVESYTRKIKAQIFFNHLSVSHLTQDHFASLLNGDWLKRIVDHKNYNPRVIASISSDSLGFASPQEFPNSVVQALDDPNLIWSKPFKALDLKCKNLLIAHYFGNEYGDELRHLQSSFDRLHRIVSGHYGSPMAPDDFEDAVKSLETGFVAIVGTKLRFVNPSVRDFLAGYLVDRELVRQLPSAATRVDWAISLWRHAVQKFAQSPEYLVGVARSFLDVLEMVEKSPTRRRVVSDGLAYSVDDDVPVAERVDALLDWWEVSKKPQFLECALTVLKSASLESIASEDGQTLPELCHRIEASLHDDTEIRKDLQQAAVSRLVDIVEGGVSLEDLATIVESLNDSPAGRTQEVVEGVLFSVIDERLSNMHCDANVLDSEDEVNEHIAFVSVLAKFTGHDSKRAEQVLYERLAEIENRGRDDRSLSHSPSIGSGHEKFSDAELRSLFYNLIEPQ